MRGEHPASALKSVERLSFPVLFWDKNGLYYARSGRHLTTCSKLALRKGFYRGLHVLDSNGVMMKVRDAEKIRGIGPFRGYNLFLEQQIAVKLHFGPMEESVSFDEVARRISRWFHQHGPELDAEGYQESVVRKANSIGELIQSYGEFYTKEFPD